MTYPEWLPVIAVTGAVLTMVGGMVAVFWHLRSLGKSFGGDSARALGIVLFIPTIVILAVVADFDKTTLSALLGTIAGYLLATGESKSSRLRKP